MVMKKYERLSAFQQFGRPLSSLWFVQSGEVEVRNTDAEVVARISSGGFFGEQVLADAGCFRDEDQRTQYFVSPATFVAFAGTELLILRVEDYLSAAMSNYFFPRSAIREAAQELADCPLLEHLPLSKRIEIAACTTEARYKRGESILQQGRVQSSVVVVLSGDVVVAHKPSSGAATQRVCLGRAGAMYGIAAAHDSVKQPIDVVAQGAVHCRLIPVLAFIEQLRPEQLAEIVQSDIVQLDRWKLSAQTIADERAHAERLALKAEFVQVPNSYKGASMGTGFVDGSASSDAAFLARDVARATESLYKPVDSPVQLKIPEHVKEIDAIFDAAVDMPSSSEGLQVNTSLQDFSVSTSFLRLPSPRLAPTNDDGEELTALERTSLHLDPEAGTGSPPRRKELRPLPPALLMQRPFTPLATKAAKNSLRASSLILHGPPSQSHNMSSISVSIVALGVAAEDWPQAPSLPPPLDPLSHAAESGFWQDKHIPKHARKPRRSSQVHEAYRMHQRVVERMRQLEIRSSPFGERARARSVPGGTLLMSMTSPMPRSPIQANLHGAKHAATLPRDLFLGLNASPVRLQPLERGRRSKK